MNTHMMKQSLIMGVLLSLLDSLALDITGPVSLYAQGKVSAEGSWLKALAFLRRFEG